ncbi:hypothetical protein RJ45_00140 [Photobacterium gaetbulicola]|uniref:Uncharacterized protein n=1 Tax=Photobacterium gaetbulicola TaxID=1295392 RepID=A0A0B9GL68_9GAMM|nr:hypothetical protein [Photobacterium gaetbulicola]KHT65595.1 hypothetical protein RJ45_00140 [Photobacterium gaetbulicola]
MNYSPLAIHCTSLCLDIIQDPTFNHFNHEDINAMYMDVYELICERTTLLPDQFERDNIFLSNVTNGVISILHQCYRHPSARNVNWVLSALELRIENSKIIA